MARTTQEIYDTLETNLAANTTLSALAANTSKTAIWRLLLWVFAYGANVIESLFDAFKTEVETLAAAAKVGNAAWYQSEVLAFQYGDSLTYLNGVYKYAVIDDTKKIVSQCAVVEGFDPLVGGVLNIKVAKGSATLSALNNTELAALNSYLQKIKFAGTKTKLISTSGDILKIAFNIYYDPIQPIDTLKPLVVATITNYVKALNFDGVLNITRLIDAVQAIDGVKDCVFISAFTKVNVGSSYVSFSRENNPYGGYFTISATTGETLNDTLNFIAV